MSYEKSSSHMLLCEKKWQSSMVLETNNSWPCIYKGLRVHSVYSRETDGNSKSLKHLMRNFKIHLHRSTLPEKRKGKNQTHHISACWTLLMCVAKVTITATVCSVHKGPQRLSDLGLKRQGTPFGWCIKRSRECGTMGGEWKSSPTRLTDSKTELG